MSRDPRRNPRRNGHRAATYQRADVGGPLTRQPRAWHDRRIGSEAFNPAEVLQVLLADQTLAAVYRNLKVSKLGRGQGFDEYGEPKPGVVVSAGRPGANVWVIPGTLKRRSIVGEMRFAGYQVGIEGWDHDPGYPGGGGETIFVPFGSPVPLFAIPAAVGLALAEANFGG